MNYTVTRVLWVAKIVAKIMGTVMRYQHFSFLIKHIRYIDSSSNGMFMYKINQYLLFGHINLVCEFVRIFNIQHMKLKVFYRYEFDIVSSDISRIPHNMHIFQIYTTNIYSPSVPYPVTSRGKFDT